MGTDKYAHSSRLKTVDPRAKLLVTAIAVVLCVMADSMAVSLVTVVFMCIMTSGLGGISPRVFLRMMRAPLAFLLIGCLTIMVSRFPSGGDVLFGVEISGWHYGFTAVTLTQGLSVMTRALGIISCVYFFVLNTPMTDLSWALGKFRVPQLIIELMELVYRFIFVLMDTMKRIRTAQASRLGYRRIKTAYRSTGSLAAMVFLRAYRKSDRIYTALESRGYTGALTTVEGGYDSGRNMYLLCLGTACLQLAVMGLEGVIFR